VSSFLEEERERGGRRGEGKGGGGRYTYVYISVYIYIYTSFPLLFNSVLLPISLSLLISLPHA